ncbi:nucleotide cyclase [Chytriomyces cf. hyalinus JEL632]|nr:nucleotide cyclase [Chytriomyces cf. hyalinus JEL632]
MIGGSSEGTPSSTGYVWFNFCLWATAVLYSISQRHAIQPSAKSFDRGDSDIYYILQSLVFLVASAVAYVSYKRTKHGVKQAMIQVLMLVNTVVAVSCFLMYLRAGYTVLDGAGNPADSIRHLAWFHDQSDLVYVACLLTGTNNTTRGRATAYSRMTFVFGFFACLARHPYDQLFGTIALVCHLRLMNEIVDMFQAAIEGTQRGQGICSADVWSLERCREVMVFSYGYISVSWFLVRINAIRFDTGELHIAVGEVVAKIVCMLVIINCSFKEPVSLGIAGQGLDGQGLDGVASSEPLHAVDKLIQENSHLLSTGDEYACATVFCSSIVGFNKLSHQTPKKEMLIFLNNLWTNYDAISKKHGIKKVEITGDAFLAIVGAPSRVTDHAERAASFALDILEMIKNVKSVSGEQVQIRIGLCSGPVTVQFVGEMNPVWLLAGDSVSTAKRMEAASKQSRIHVSQSTYSLIKTKFVMRRSERVNTEVGDFVTSSYLGCASETFYVDGRL